MPKISSSQTKSNSPPGCQSPCKNSTSTWSSLSPVSSPHGTLRGKSIIAPPAIPLQVGADGASVENLMDFAEAVENECSIEQLFIERRARWSHLEAKLFSTQLPGASRRCSKVTTLVQELGMEISIPRDLFLQNFVKAS
ncbi:hypothetical protein SERLA73DRAFT_192102 [Serpula lacrymans var. lacrymans S7.3]|uniref:Uncharacterized protein n=2 Tax=Serpula lacrymans var. lacrymans TaxID=341189 RepID=F8QIZ4_SERL3|nr:uncharacterized protein SERLADRAFT_458739 [Serpula lacrymans var. lacrymans S7.9]EGN91730.1 hypothetical protein SERLA73DRAFT_192102 [Serpula lacrymans var. lacrymans S7.3]EGO28347.1 hypothetical protein SERLADRAFT_458739 [Serpula lacrymans var. lacrymans S7.9]